MTHLVRSWNGQVSSEPMSAFDAVWNLGLKASRRLQSAHKPLVRYARRSGREQEHQAFRDEAQAIERRIAEVAAGREPIVVGPWLAEVGYEVLYWIPFLRWFQDAHGVAARAADRRVARRARRAVSSRSPAATWTSSTWRRRKSWPPATPSGAPRTRAAGRSKSGPASFDSELAERARAEGQGRGWADAASVAALWPVPQRLVRQPADGRAVAPRPPRDYRPACPATHPGPARRLHRRQAVRRPGALHFRAVGGRRPCAGRLALRVPRRWCCSTTTRRSTSTATSI